jgi:hypothetical protein
MEGYQGTMAGMWRIRGSCLWVLQKYPCATHQSVQLSTGHTPATGEARRLGQGTPQQIREDLYHYQELGIPVVVCNFAAPHFEALGRAMEIFAIQVMAYFPGPA